MKQLLLALSLVIVSAPSLADHVRIAVASNFAPAMREVAAAFKDDHAGHGVSISVDSTGMQYAQIIGGATYDLFFASDSTRPELLERKGFAVAGSRFSYARGQLMLWSADGGVVDSAGKVLSTERFDQLALANPKLSPYGRAARQVLQTMDLWEPLKNRLLIGQNISQTYQYVNDGNARLGFVALTQLRETRSEDTGSLWQVPQDYYQPIVQQAVLLSESPGARDFLDYFRSEKVRGIIREHGYQVP